jgi:hypothetical protein
MHFPAWIENVEKIPALLKSTTFFLNGQRWGVREWLENALSRKASDPKDLVFAGLSLMDAKGLIIDQSLQLIQSCFNSEISHPRLWKVLHADYNVETSFVLLNLAACLLTQYDFNTLFSTTLRYRMRATRSTNFELPLFRQPSWVPAPAHWTVRPSKPVALLSNASGQFPLPANTRDPGPKISADGTTLFLTAARLDTISQHCRLGSMLFNAVKEEWLDLLEWISLAVPRVNPKTGVLGLDTFVRVALSKYRIEGPLTQFSEAELLEACCRTLDAMPERMLSLDEQPLWMSKISEPLHMESSERKLARDLKARCDKIKAAHPDAPWPDHTKGISAPETSRSRASSHFNGGKNNVSSREHNARYDEFKKSIGGTKFVACTEDWSTQSMFITNEGYMGIGPNVLRDGDAVFLIQGGNMPYIFAHVDEVLRRRASQIRKRLDDKHARISEDETSTLRAELEDVEHRIGGKDGWQLVGETYVEGVMKGEVAGQMDERAQRYSFV